MTDNELLVTVSGPALSVLSYENARSTGDQMGFLLGEVVVFVTKTVNDSDRQIEHVKTHVDIHAVMACSPVDCYYNGVGKVNEKKLKDIIRDQSKYVVGWFSFRKDSPLVPTLRDKVLHKGLTSYFSNITNNKKEYFIMCLLTSSISERGGTHRFRHVFMRYKEGIFQPLSLRIKNLGNGATKPDESDYKPTPLKKSLNEPDPLSKIIDEMKKITENSGNVEKGVELFKKAIGSLSTNQILMRRFDLTKTPGVELVTSVETAAQKRLRELIPKVAETDREVAELEKQVREALEKVREKKMKEWETKEKLTMMPNDSLRNAL